MPKTLKSRQNLKPTTMLNLKNGLKAVACGLLFMSIGAVNVPANASYETDPGVKCRCGVSEGVPACAANGDDDKCATEQPCRLNDNECILPPGTVD